MLEIDHSKIPEDFVVVGLDVGKIEIGICIEI